MSLNLFRPQTCFIEPIRLSGYTESGIYVFDHDDTKDLSGSPISLHVRVTDTFECREVESGKTYIIDNPYAFSRIDHNGETKYCMHEDNFLSEVVGYDNASVN